MRFCPNCGTSLSQYTGGEHNSPPADTTYNQTATWKDIVARAEEIRATPPSPESLVMPAVDRLKKRFKEGPLKTVVHLAFDRDVVPSGGVLHQITMLEGRTAVDPKRLEAMGYSVVAGKVTMVDDVPVGAVHSAIEYWGGDRQHKRWHLAEPCKLEASRNGDPFFMDANMVAFGAAWTDLERIELGLFELFEMFTNGFGEHRRVIGKPLVLEVVPH